MAQILKLITMKYLSIISIIFLLAISCQNNESQKADAKETVATELEAPVDYVEYSVSIEGMTCTGCEETIEAGVTKIEGVGSVEANFTDGKAILQFDKNNIDTLEVKNVIEAAGYKVVSFNKVPDSAIAE